MLTFSPPAYAVAPHSTPFIPTKEELVTYAKERAVEANLNPQKVLQVIGCETKGTWNPKIQSDAYNKRDGGRELSFGLAQIHLPAHPDISYEQAIDPYFAIDFLITSWQEGHQEWWTCY